MSMTAFKPCQQHQHISNIGTFIVNPPRSGVSRMPNITGALLGLIRASPVHLDYVIKNGVKTNIC